jgi:hypothetical protein
VPVELLWQAMTDVDPATGRSRGFIVLDRGPGQRLPLHFRLSAGDGLGALVSTLLEEAPALLASAPADSPEALVAGWVNAVEARIAGALCRGLGVGGDHASARLPPEHQAAVAAVLAELRATRAHRAVVGARATEGARRVPDDVLATLLLALPEGVLTALPPPAREAVATLRTPGEVGTALAAELAALGEQLTTLRQWQCSVPRR